MDILEELGSKPSISEENGLLKLRSTDNIIFSPGISTAGFAEIRMVKDNPDRKVIATTVDQKGLEFANETIKKLGYEKQIETRLEDLSKEWNYPENYFDFIYARLVLQYLSSQDLDKVLAWFYSSLKSGGLLFVVVRSVKNVSSKDQVIKFDSLTKMTTYKDGDMAGGIAIRYFHTPETMTVHMSKAGFIMNEIKEYKERLSKDFMRKKLSDDENHLIEVTCSK
ncbi:MAG: class I SAM-dependent methyltransferase [Microgenomates group bacterium]